LAIEKKVWDVNILAIFLVEDHPGHDYVAPIVRPVSRGSSVSDIDLGSQGRGGDMPGERRV